MADKDIQNDDTSSTDNNFGNDEMADKDEDSNADLEHAVITIKADNQVVEAPPLLERANEGPTSEEEIIPAPDLPCQEDALSSHSASSNRAPKKKSRTRNLRRYTGVMYTILNIGRFHSGFISTGFSSAAKERWMV